MPPALPSPTRLLDQLWARPDDPGDDRQVFAILDGARDPRIAPAVDNAPESACLFHGDGTDEVAAAAPWLVRLERRSEYTRWLLAEGWGHNWGIFMEARTSVRDLMKHFRPCLQAEYRKKKLFFRFFDPRVLRVYLPTCHAGELTALFGPVKRFWMEARDPTVMLEHRLERNRLVTREVRLYVLDGRGDAPGWANRPQGAR